MFTGLGVSVIVERRLTGGGHVDTNGLDLDERGLDLNQLRGDSHTGEGGGDTTGVDDDQLSANLDTSGTLAHKARPAAHNKRSAQVSATASA